MKLPDKLAFVDLETTGANLSHDRIIEIGIVRVENNQVIEIFQSLVNPDRHLPSEIELLTGIKAAQLENAPSFYSLKSEIQRLVKDCVFVAHNVRFDYSFLKNHFRQYEEDFSPKQLCTVKLAKKLYPKLLHHDLSTLIEVFNLECESRHRALDDAKAIFQFYQIAQKEFNQEQLSLAFDQVYKRPSIPINLSTEVLDSLPECPGVYLFYGTSGIPLYIGKSINIRKRVLQHFSSDHLSSIEMKIAQQVQRVEFIKTSGELGALLREASLVKKMQPLYNRMLRHARKLIALKLVKDPKSYNTIKLEDLEQVTAEDLEDILGIFKSKKQAKQHLINLAKEHQLCEKLLGLENLGKACFGYRLGRCKGGCVGKETSQIYNLRFQIAFAKFKFKPWPFDGPIQILEQDPQTGKVEAFILDKWCYLGMVKVDEGGTEEEMVNDISFDLDTYKILHRF